MGIADVDKGGVDIFSGSHPRLAVSLPTIEDWHGITNIIFF
jgi:hypothetical protein